MTPQEAFDRLPKSIRIGGYDWTVVELTVADMVGRHRAGECRPAALELAISRNLSSVHRIVDTTLHEICHAMFFGYDIQGTDDEERTVERMSNGLMILFRDNPDLLQWVDDSLHYRTNK